ncbi:hypothetical protein BKN14_04335 [Candidatus Gracilibacteria bacterium HOT-871]|nr:hypothetical protein BKN14_04335 [Candidatus Gracilibacteria bacterium HOT-871]MBB1564979.1 hypothetical protein [Candidatus Gracilibacteria bacterium]MBF0913622.1 hypothetical protein [Candidatus Gracilibacteria bacterium]RKW22536.1 MAG: hypothetical protein D8B46_05200 [Candidatus Gracilibacteria bacterium]
MAVKGKQKKEADKSTQRYLPFSGIKENIIIMKDNSVRIILKCSTINFLLKNTDEQDSIIISFQRFLNSIDFPIQIMVRSKKLDIDSYLNNLNSRALKQENQLLQNQTYEYIAYLKKLIEVAQIMKKEFYIVVPFDLEENKSVKDNGYFGFITEFWKSINQNQELGNIRSQLRNFTNNKKEVLKRVNVVQTGLENIGIKAEPISKEELVIFLADYYNPRLDSLNTVGNIDNYNLS